ncbi:AAA family ATPase [Haloplanus salilacus]|uniref:AAA family ATPase n=1 Tax=Haloplanus salilacus TaxID=2949994 RepID=UPI0030D5369F
MTDDLISEMKAEFESGGNWPYEPGEHGFTANPFAEKWPDPRLFAGYEDELRRLRENIQRNVNTFIIGPFGTGKTILTKTMYDVLADVDGYLPVFVSVQKGRYSKAMAKRILDELGEPVDPAAAQADLYEDVTAALQERYENDVRTVMFYDEVINGSDGTLRQILHLQRDIEDWEPVFVFNGTAHMLDQIQSKIEPLSDRIGDEITLSGLDSDGAFDLVNKRLRYYCAASERGERVGCSHDEDGVEPFTRDAIDLIHQDVTPYPRHLRRQCNTVIEEGARAERERIDFDFVRRVLAEDASQKLEQLSDLARDIVGHLDDDGPNTANAVTEVLDVSPYHVQESLTDLEKEGLIRATEGTRGIEYKLTDQASRELSNLTQS